MRKISDKDIIDACDKLKELLLKKNADYGNSVQEQFIEYGENGWITLAIRIEDKLRRFKHLSKLGGNEKVNEKRSETCLDGAGYFILASILMDMIEEK